MKEPHYFATDLPGCRVVTEVADYDALFQQTDAGRLRGEASTLYCYSKNALAEMLRLWPRLKVIVVVRNPIDLFQSFHNHLLTLMIETEGDPELAWRLQAERSRGHRVPAGCREPALLQYSTICGQGKQIQRFFEIVPAEQRLVFTFDEVIGNPQGVMPQIFDYLGVDSTAPLALPHENEFAENKSAFVARCVLAVRGHSWFTRFRTVLLGGRYEAGFSPLVWLERSNRRKAVRPPLGDAFRAELALHFRDDVKLLGDLLGRSFVDWGVISPEGDERRLLA